MSKEKRFVKTYSDGAFGSNEIWVDRKAGVNYLYHITGNAAGLCVLVDRDGKPVVTPVPREDEE